jgi:glycine/D-amino acid oxidase-like deaminating enzyme
MVSFSRRWLLKIFAAVGGASTCRLVPFPEIQFCAYARAGGRPRSHNQSESEDSYRRDRGGCVWRMDSPLSTAASWCARDFAGRLGATQLWKENQQRWNLKLLHQTGVLWMVTAGDDHSERESLLLLRNAGIAYQELSVQEMTARWPQINLEAIHWGIYEPEGGFLTARVACQAVLDGFLAEGGEYRQVAVVPRDLDGKWDSLSLSDGSKLDADQYVFACGPWLGRLFPETVGNHIRPTK